MVILRKYSTKLLFICLITVQSCINDKPGDTGSTIWGNLSIQLADTLQHIGDRVQLKEIDPAKDNQIIGANGTRIIIYANSIVDLQGSPVSGTVLLALKEHYTIGSFISGNLQTKSHDEILQTQGMIYFNATNSSKQQLRIDSKRPIRIEFPVMKHVQGVKLFKGSRDQQGNMNWDTVGDPVRTLVPFPIRSLSPNWELECVPNFGFVKDKKLMDNRHDRNYIPIDSIDLFENTLIATREFRERYYHYCNPDFTRLYIANLDKNMWEIDEMMVQYFLKDSAKNVSFEIESKPEPFRKGDTITKDQWDAHNSLIESAKNYYHHQLENFRAFAAQRLTRVDTARRMDTSFIRQTNTAFVAYNALEFGWVNVDYFYKDPKAENIKLSAKTNLEADIIHLILPERNIILNGIAQKGNVYRFTNEEKMYSKLPRGEKAIIVCMSIADNKLYFADKEIVIGNNEVEELNMQLANGEWVKARLLTYQQ